MKGTELSWITNFIWVLSNRKETEGLLAEIVGGGGDRG